jgi:hypothetical protein
MEQDTSQETDSLIAGQEILLFGGQIFITIFTRNPTAESSLQPRVYSDVIRFTVVVSNTVFSLQAYQSVSVCTSISNLLYGWSMSRLDYTA